MTVTSQQQRQLRTASRDRFLRARRAERAFQRNLSSISNRVDSIVKRFLYGRGPRFHITDLVDSLNEYASNLSPWATIVTRRMHADVSRRDATSWFELAREMGGALRREIVNAPTGATMKEALALQVDLITSLPREAAQRVHRLAIEGLANGTRAEDLAKEIMRTGQVTLGRARTIARTETSRTASLLLESRAEHIGSISYRWHTVGDSDVRPEHRRLNGKVFRWAEPPVAGSNGERANPGCIYNCRCWAEPILPDEVFMAVQRKIRRAA